MKKLSLTLAALAAASMMSGCAGLSFSSHGVNGAVSWYAETRASEAVTSNNLASKTGEACSQSILGIVTTGDSSVATAAKNGKITKIAAVDNKFTNILGLFATYCAVVTGE